MALFAKKKKNKEKKRKRRKKKNFFFFNFMKTVGSLSKLAEQVPQFTTCYVHMVPNLKRSLAKKRIGRIVCKIVMACHCTTRIIQQGATRGNKNKNNNIKG